MNAALHVGLLTSDLSHRHGWAHYSLSLVEALRRAGVAVTVIAPEDSPEVPGLVVQRLLPASLSMGRLTLLRQRLLVPQVRARLRDCTVIHATIEPFAPLAAWVAGERPLYITGHGTYVRAWASRPWPVNAVYRSAFLRARLVCVSQYTARVARATLPGVDTVVVNNGVNAARYENPHPLTAFASPLYGEGGQDHVLVTKHGLTVLAVGAVKARKGTLELVRAMAAVRQAIPGVQCVVVGRLDLEPDYVARVWAAIAQLDLGGCVHLLGHVPEAELMGWYQAADVFALPSINIGDKFEGYGLVYLEASAAGLPVIGTTDCGAEDAIDDGVTGLLITQARVAEELPQAIVRVLRDPALAARMGAAGRDKALRQTWDHVAARMIALYNGQSLRQFGSAKGQIRITDDFDAPLMDFDEYTK